MPPIFIDDLGKRYQADKATSNSHAQIMNPDPVTEQVLTEKPVSDVELLGMIQKQINEDIISGERDA